MKTSVIIPAWNEEKNIKSALLSIKSQTKKPFEVIVVNNNSTDNTVNIAKSFDFVTVVNQNEIQGITPTRDKGFDIAQGDLLLKLDADTILEKHWIEKAEEKFSKDKKLGALSGKLVYHLPIIDNLLIYPYIYLLKLLTGTKPLFGPAYILKKSIWERIKNDVCTDDKKVHEDINISINIAKANAKIEIFKDIITYSSNRKILQDPITFFITDYPLRVVKTIIHR